MFTEVLIRGADTLQVVTSSKYEVLILGEVIN